MMSVQEVENFSSNSVTSEVARQIKAVNYSLTQQIARLCELMREVKEDQFSRRQKN